jgi:hypothetical protein
VPMFCAHYLILVRNVVLFINASKMVKFTPGDLAHGIRADAS